MPAGNRASYAKTGFIVIAGVVAIIATLAYFGGVHGKGDEFLAETWYDSAVSGLSIGSEVAYRGVKIGEVKKISFIGADYLEALETARDKIRIVLALNKRLMRPRPGSTPLDTLRHMIRKGVRASLGTSGITGLSRIDLDFPALPTPEAAISWTPHHVCIPPAPSMLESFADSAMKIMHHLNGMDLASVCSNLTRTVESAASTVSHADELIVTATPAIDEIVNNLENASRRLKEFACEVSDNPSLLLRSRDSEPLPETSR